jgi:phosphoribosylanthranilate isomerase
VTEIKICGLTNREDAACAAACGADAVGFIFHQKSPRYVTPEIAQKIIKDLPVNIIKVGVFVNLKPAEIKWIIAFCDLDMIQLHGAESPAFCSQFPRSRVIKAIALRGEDDLQGLQSYPVAAMLVDAYDPVRHGGTGEKADWGLAARVKEQHPLILAGGLSLTNIREAIETVVPDAVDISSGVEITPRRKDHAKVREIIELVHSLGKNTTTIFGTSDHPFPDGR